ncbi:formate/nitrite transporter family protein [Algicola sagamiensis]|uniref:formate/nitrite transporter family protein n=1 Tax=Algicola sagamiensis TaxID=163869 RepID=UPI00035E2741|nr:formate/nitrite transporter family protein [Algicola sagamiensis]
MTDKKIVSPEGDVITTTSEAKTKRVEERAEEDRQFQPVIIKRTDESFRHPDDILEIAIQEGLEQLSRPALSLFLSACAAGLILCFTVMAVAVMTLATESLPNLWLQRIAVALFYPLGFVLCIMSRTQLFTEHTATAVYPVLDTKVRSSALIRLWVIVIFGNLVGGMIGAILLKLVDPISHLSQGYIRLADHLTAYPPLLLLISAILAGWLMALGAWIVLATHSTLSQIVSIYLVTFLIGLGGFHHSIAGSIELFVSALVSDNPDIQTLAYTICIALLGNLIGGSVFVAVLNYGHIRHSQRR